MSEEKHPVPMLEYATPPGPRRLHRGWWGVAVALWMIGFVFYTFFYLAVALIVVESHLKLLSDGWFDVILSILLMGCIVAAALTRGLMLRIEPIVIGLVAVGPLLLSTVCGTVVVLCGGREVAMIFLGIGCSTAVPGLVAMACGLSATAAARRAEGGRRAMTQSDRGDTRNQCGSARREQCPESR